MPSDLSGSPYLQLGGRGKSGSTHVLSETNRQDGPHLTTLKVGYWGQVGSFPRRANLFVHDHPWAQARKSAHPSWREGRRAGILPPYPKPRYLQAVSSAPAKGAHDFLHPSGLPHQDRGLHQAAYLSRDPRAPLTRVPRWAPGQLGPPAPAIPPRGTVPTRSLTSSAIAPLAWWAAPKTAPALQPHCAGVASH